MAGRKKLRGNSERDVLVRGNTPGSRRVVVDREWLERALGSGDRRERGWSYDRAATKREPAEGFRIKRLCERDPGDADEAGERRGNGREAVSR